jgi:RNA polymerase sigma-70 factor (ECF subfamily)
MGDERAHGQLRYVLPERDVLRNGVSEESEIREALAGGDTARAAQLTVAAYGPEIRSFLAAIHGVQADAVEVFAQASEDLVRSFASFRGECAVRTWFYALAKNASRRHFDDTFRRRGVALSEALEQVEGQIERPRTETSPFLQTEWKRRLRALREGLSPDDRALLVLRVDRQMAWDEIARVLLSPEAESASLRKRFERIKAKLRADAQRDGWPIEP